MENWIELTIEYNNINLYLYNSMQHVLNSSNLIDNHRYDIIQQSSIL
jgi:hypothetical protein